MRWKPIAVALMLLVPTQALAQKGGSSRPSSSPSRPTFGGGSTSRPSPSPPASRPTFGGGSGPSKPAASPPAAHAPPKASDPGSALAKARALDRSAAEKKAAEAQKPPPSRPTTPKVEPKPEAKTGPKGPVSAGNAPNIHREIRVQKTYVVHHYGGWTPHPYSDPFHPMLTGFLLARLAEPGNAYAARYAYHHWDEFDEQRRAELLRENAGLRGELDRMRAEGIAPDRSYVMPSDAIDPDLVALEPSPPPGPSPADARAIVGAFLAILAACGLIYLLCIHKFRSLGD